ncbi:MAG: DUF3604 domain-containing protein [Planctomycetota bacterium]
MAEIASDPLPAWERPIRLPEDLALLHSDPPTARAGRKGSWTLRFDLAEAVQPGARLGLQLHGGRNNKGAFGGVQTGYPDREGYVTARAGDEKVEVEGTERAGTLILRAPPAGLPEGGRLNVRLGEGTVAPPARMLSKFFVLFRTVEEDAEQDDDQLPSWAVADGDERHLRLGAGWADANRAAIVGACTMHVLGGPACRLRAYAPSHAAPGAPLEVLIRPEDERGNLAARPPGDLVVRLGDRLLSAEVEPVPDSTCRRVRMRLPEQGVRRISVEAPDKNLRAVTNPVVCSAQESELKTYWGMLHGHTEISDGRGTLRHYFRQMRDEAGLDFGATADHDHLWETPDRMWRETCEAVAGWNAPGDFVTFLGYEWAKWRQNGDGDRNVYYLRDRRPMYRSDEGNYPRPPDLFEALAEEEALVIPHHPAHWGNWCDWKDHDPHRERLVEIYQMRGSYECPEQEGNPLPERCGRPPVREGFVRRALAMGWRVGFTAGGDDHIGHAGTEFLFEREGGVRYKAGLTGVLALELTRPALWRALRARRVIGTSGPRILLSYTLNGRPLGSELDAARDPELNRRRVIRVEAHATAPVDRIEIIRSNRVVHSAESPGADCRLEWVDETPLERAVLPPAKFCPHPFCFYYVRLVQADGEVAWASPAWVDPA